MARALRDERTHAAGRALPSAVIAVALVAIVVVAVIVVEHDEAVRRDAGRSARCARDGECGGVCDYEGCFGRC